MKLAPALGLCGLLLSLLNTAVLVTAYTQLPAITMKFMDEVQTEIQGLISDAVGEAMLDALPKELDQALPALPTETGPPIQLPDL
tara:strand:- start:459 stop:713 length:255 start_codon:yes stop_codon:yes gene_type:complete